MPGTFLWNFIKIWLVVSEKMFKEKVKARTDGRTDNGPWHKIAGLRPVELKKNMHLSFCINREINDEKL